jgi:uncharacterized protein YegJ (DUF2314 family)
MRRTLLCVVILILAVTGCGRKPKDRVITVDSEDPRMNAAIEQARSTVGTFITALRAPKPTQLSFSVKMAITDGTHTEHMWLAPVSYDGKQFHGTLNNDPETVSNVKIGDKASIEPSKISDSMYVENGKLVGGYTIRVLRDGLPPGERTEFDRSVPFKIE